MTEPNITTGQPADRLLKQILDGLDEAIKQSKPTKVEKALDKAEMLSAKYVTLLRPKPDMDELMTIVIGQLGQALIAVHLIRKLFPGTSRRNAFQWYWLAQFLQQANNQYALFTKKRPKGV